MSTFDANFIDGLWVSASGSTDMQLINPATEEPSGTVRNGAPADVDRAVRAARTALAGWRNVPALERAEILERLCQAIERNTEAFAQAMAEEIGSPLWFGRGFQVPMPMKNLAEAIAFIRGVDFSEAVRTSVVMREPIGVVAAITPWNAPLHQIVAKVGAALAAGCTVVLKPSELTPKTAMLFAELVRKCGVPAGAFNMVFGDAASVGEPLVTHPEVDIVSFTGATSTGRRIGECAGREIKKVVMELGGKSASILLEDAPLEQAVETVLAQCFANSGQVCVAQSRLLVPYAWLPKVEQISIAKAQSWVVGDPFAAETRLGPVATANQRQRIRRYIAGGIDEKARLITGGIQPPAGCDRGYYVAPTIFSAVSPEMTIAREEIFGPVLSIVPYRSVEQAIEIANGIPYGLSGGVWSAESKRALDVARRMRTGQVSINGAPQNFATPFGGCRLSGFGRENGRFGVEEFLQYKAVHGAVAAI
jgi:acyl-CoA reductase-like NAD-dependent aldehyde dehydrogenase